MHFRITAFLLIFLLSACATNKTTKQGQKKGKWVYYRTDGLIDRAEFYKPFKDTISKVIAFQLGWSQKQHQDSLIYGEELIHINQYRYNSDGELQRIEKIDTSYLFLDLFQTVPPAVNPNE